MPDLDEFLAAAWRDHADHPAKVAARLADALSLVDDDDGVTRLAGLAHHVLGEHLGRWAEGVTFLDQLSSLESYGSSGAEAIARCRASFRLCGGTGGMDTEASASDQCRISSMAAASLARRDLARSARFLEDAASLAKGLPASDPGIRALAANCNNMAVALQEASSTDSSARALMIRAAQEARVQWERAGTWLEVERAEYRLALSWLAADEPDRALQHAEHCMTIVCANGAVPLELFFAFEARCLAACAQGNRESSAEALTGAQAAFHSLSPDDREWCQVTLDKLFKLR